MAGALCVEMPAVYCWAAEEVCPEDRIPKGAGYELLEASIAISMQVADQDYIRSVPTTDPAAELAVDKNRSEANSPSKSSVVEPHQPHQSSFARSQEN